MSKFLDIVKHEAREAVFPAVFFLILFSVTTVTKGVIVPSYSFTKASFVVIVVGALTVTKAVLIVNALSLANRFRSRPLIVGVLWKTALFALMVLVFRWVEELIPLDSKHGGLEGAMEALIEETKWARFWAVQMWMWITLLAFTTFCEIDEFLGVGALQRMFLHGAGPAKPS